MRDNENCRVVRKYMQRVDAPVVIYIHSQESSGPSRLEMVHGPGCTRPERRTLEERRKERDDD